jgi:serine protease Do
MQDSPAAAAGLKVGDVIIAFNDQRLLNSSQLPPLVGATRVDTPASVKVLRDGKEQTLSIRVGRLPDEEAIAVGPEEPPKPDEIEQLGLSVIDIAEDVREELGIDIEGGAFVGAVEPGPAQEAGIRRGDIVVMFDGEDVQGAKHLRDLIAAADDKRSVAVLIRRGDSPLFIALKMSG